MKAVIQRVKHARIVVDQKEIAKIGPGLLTFLGIGKEDEEQSAAQKQATIDKLITKIISLRIFEDPQGKMNLSLQDTQGEHLIVSQFTLYADCSQGKRPSFMAAAAPEIARSFYDHAIELSQQKGIRTQGGVFGADMKIELLNDGPVTIQL